ncbi:hypothetical protein FXO38_17398 [Capsicum annuum]|nr:hypothetical protein FXO38_17398 [Capsicum annuum]
MDNPPSFSLGITLLDATVQDIPLGFVPTTFDEQDFDWAENRSKHRNIPVTMKKLKDKTVSKSKKSTSKANKKKFDDSGQPRLPKDNKDELHVWVQGEILKFTILELAIITGLKCTGNIDDYMYTSSSKSALMSRCSKPEDIVEDSRYINFPWGKHSYKNIQPTTDEVSRLDLSFSKDFETCDPTTYASTSDVGKLKRTAAELQQRVGTIAEQFGDFSTIPPREILIKNVADKGEIGVSKIQHHHHREIGVSPQSYQHKSVSSSSKQHEGTSKSSLDGDEIKNYINKCFAEKMDELVTLISKIPAEVVKALKNEENKQSQHENDAKGSINVMEVSRDEESNKHHFLEEQQLLDVNAANKDAGREDDFENEDCSDLEALEYLYDEIMTYEEESNDEELGKKNIPDVEDLPVWKLQASKENAPAKRERKKSRVLRSPYISKYGSGSKDSVDFDKEEKLKYAFDGYTINQVLPNELMIDYSQWIVVGLLKTHSAK